MTHGLRDHVTVPGTAKITFNLETDAEYKFNLILFFIFSFLFSFLFT